MHHRALNHSTAENFMRSAKAPTNRPGVMMAKVIWKTKNSTSGIVPLMLSPVMPLRKVLEKPPMKGLLAVKARL